jgi:hypothetical protein
MLDRLTPLAHFSRVLIEPVLSFENLFMLSTRDPSLLAGGGALVDDAALAGVGPVAVDQPMFFVRKMVGKLPKRPSTLAFEVIFGNVTVMPASSHTRISVLLK